MTCVPASSFDFFLGSKVPSSFLLDALHASCKSEPNCIKLIKNDEVTNHLILLNISIKKDSIER